MRAPTNRLLVVVALAGTASLLLAAIGSRGVRVEDPRQWTRHVSPLEAAKRSRVVAVAVAPDGTGAVGLAYGQGELGTARTRALQACENARIADGDTPPCALYSVDERVVFDFASLEPDPAAAPASECLADPVVDFYLMNVRLRIYRRLGISFREHLDAPLRVELGPDGAVRSATPVTAAADGERARRALAAAGPYGPLFGPLACLGRTPFLFEPSLRGLRQPHAL